MGNPGKEHCSNKIVVRFEEKLESKETAGEKEEDKHLLDDVGCARM